MNERLKPGRMRMRFVLKIVGFLACVGAILYWAMFAPIKVVATPVKKVDVVAEVMGTGTLEARVTTTIGPKISGRIAEVLVDQGERVKRGDLLVRLDAEELQQQVEIARANLAARKAAIERLQADKQRTSAILTQSLKDFERQQTLASSKGCFPSPIWDKARESSSHRTSWACRIRSGDGRSTGRTRGCGKIARLPADPTGQFSNRGSL